MAAFLNTCRFTPTAGGLSDFVVSVAVVGFKTPAQANAANGRVYKWRAESADLTQWEEFEGAYVSGTTTVPRTTILASSTGAKVNFTVAPEVFCVALKEDLISVEEANSFTAAQKSQACSNIAAVQTTGNQTITGGFNLTPNNLGTPGSFTCAPLSGNYQYFTNAGALTITAPTTDCAIDYLMTNTTAGAVTFSGFTVGAVTGDALTTTNSSKFIISIRRINAVSTYIIKALQ